MPKGRFPKYDDTGFGGKVRATKKIQGRRFLHAATVRTKTAAKNTAKSIRRDGDRAVVVKAPRMAGKGVLYSVYGTVTHALKKGRRRR